MQGNIVRRADRLFQIVQYLRNRRLTTAKWLGGICQTRTLAPACFARPSAKEPALTSTNGECAYNEVRVPSPNGPLKLWPFQAF